MINYRCKHCIHYSIWHICRAGKHNQIFHAISSDQHTLRYLNYVALSKNDKADWEILDLMIKPRRLNLLEHANKFGCNVIAAFQPENIFYLTGFWGEGIAICKECDVISTERGDDLIYSLISKVDKKMICTDCSDYAIIRRIQDEIGAKSLIVNVEPFLLTRIIKDEEEIEMIEMAAKIIDTLYRICTDEIKVGLSERELQARLLFEAMKLGTHPTSYKTSLN